MIIKTTQAHHSPCRVVQDAARSRMELQQQQQMLLHLYTEFIFVTKTHNPNQAYNLRTDDKSKELQTWLSTHNP